MKIGIFGGTFDPIHNGHLAVAEETRNRLNLVRTLFVPTGRPWLKPGRPISLAGHRVEMVHLAITDKPYYSLSAIEVDRDGMSYTLDTLAELRAQIRVEDELFFILGWDSLVELPQWKEPGRIIRLCKLVAVPRPGYPRPELASLEVNIPGLAERVIILDKPQVDISAFGIRERVAKGLSINGLVPEVVERYIREKKLYILGS